MCILLLCTLQTVPYNTIPIPYFHFPFPTAIIGIQKNRHWIWWKGLLFRLQDPYPYSASIQQPNQIPEPNLNLIPVTQFFFPRLKSTESQISILFPYWEFEHRVANRSFQLARGEWVVVTLWPRIGGEPRGNFRGKLVRQMGKPACVWEESPTKLGAKLHRFFFPKSQSQSQSLFAGAGLKLEY